MAAANGSPGEGGPSDTHVDEPPASPRGALDATVRTFLIADVRGYTRFTQEFGDEEAGGLAAAFAALARESVESQGGEVIELRGDEALCMFGSARQALRAAVDLQLRFRQRTEDGPAFALPIGIGLDAGEAVPIEGGYRGGALNTASRLCSLAAPGQILATDTVVSLARRLEGIRFAERRPVRLKGLEKPVRIIEVVPEAGLPPLPEASETKRRRLTKGRAAILAAAGAALLAAAVALAIVRATGADYLSQLDPYAIGAIDAEGAGIEAQLTVGTRPTAIATGGGFLWVTSETDGTLSRVDSESRTTESVRVGESADGVAYGGKSIWVTDGEERTLVQVDPESLRIVQTIGVGNGPRAIAVGEGAVWVANSIDGTVSRIDLGSGKKSAIPVAPSPAGIALGAGSVWVTSEANGTVVRLDPRSGAVVEAISVGNGPTAVAFGEGSVWIANRQDGTVWRIDPSTSSVTATIDVGANPAGVATDSGAVWVTTEGDGTLVRIDPDADEIDETIPVTSSPSGIALDDGTVWVTTLPSLASHRGGVLRVETPPVGCECIDPAFSGSWVEGQVAWPLAYDGLVAYRRVGGIAGTQLVGNLVNRLPAPTDGGRTYTFQLRPGILFSDGSPLRASDFRYSLERLLTINPDYFFYYSAIVGASECSSRPPERCDLSEGIEVNDHAGLITIRLTDADPDFLYKLAIPFASVVPTGTPLRVVRTEPIPTTGAYRIASFDPDEELKLIRNPHFRAWSKDARPDGYPDEIRFHLSEDVEAQLAAVEEGQADWMFDPPLERQQALLTGYPGQLHSDAAPWTDYMFLNTRVPPFDDIRVRQALNYAVDREKVVEFMGGPAAARTTCQVLPPALPGFQPYCPYTSKSNPAGTWAAPDMARARSLVTASGTKGARIEVLAAEAYGRLEYSRYVTMVLRRLGYRSSLRIVPREDYYAYVGDSRNRAQIGPVGWYADAAPAFFLRDLFSCASFQPRDPSNLNFSQFCDRRIDAQMRRAGAAQTADPVSGNALWAGVDHALVDQAAALPLVNALPVTFVSERVGNYQFHPQWATLLDQLWVE